MTHEAALLVALLLALAACVALAAGLIAGQRNRARLAEQLKTSIATEKSAVRQFRLASHGLRATGMALQGHAEHLEGLGMPDTAGIGNAAASVLDVADYMHEWAEHAETTHVLNEEVLALGPAVDEAVSIVTLAIRPGRRTWNVDPDVLAMRLNADRRALRHLLTRALSVAARASSRDDSIVIRLESAELEGAKKAVALIIEAQPGPAERTTPAVIGSGPDLRLTLARTLMAAHGGTLEVEQRGGVSVRMTFPFERVVKRSDAVHEAPEIAAADGQNDDRRRGVSVT